MNRTCIFSIYSYNSQIEEWRYEIIKGIKKVANQLIIVINGNIESNDSKKLSVYADEILVRANLGFDAGAYKDIINSPRFQMELKNIDELVLMNDTFWGPIYPFENMFERMAQERVDFWGITKSAAGKLGNVSYDQHIQGYFIVIRKSILMDCSFIEYWRQIKYPLDYLEAIQVFEIEFTRKMAELGYAYTSYMDVNGAGQLLRYNSNIYLDFFDELIVEYNCPVLKRKALSLKNYNRFYKLLSFIDNNLNYKANLIKDYVNRLDDQGLIRPFSYRKIRDFSLSHKKIYIYGHGAYGKSVYSIVELYNSHIQFIVSTAKEGEDALEWGEVVFGPSEGMIIAVSEQYYYEILDRVRGKLSEEHLLLPHF